MLSGRRSRGTGSPAGTGISDMRVWAVGESVGADGKSA